MKTQLFLLNGLSIAAYLAWFGWFCLKALGRAFGNSNPSTGPGDVFWVFILVGIATAACAVGSFFAPARSAKVVALAPLALVLLGNVFIGAMGNARAAKYHRKQADETAAAVRKLSGISRDYIRKIDEHDRYNGTTASFLTHDRELHTIVRIDVGERSHINAGCFGRINGDILETWEAGDAFERMYRQYLDPEGKTIFDRYTLRHRPDQDYEEYHLEKYKP